MKQHHSDRHRVYTARLVLETLTPLSISSGRDGLSDNLLVRDANGLPAIPGSSFAGVLRSVCSKTERGKSSLEHLFGRPGGGEDVFEGASRVQVSWGCLHDSFDQPVEGLLLGEEQLRLKDPILADARQEAPVRRHRVRMDHRGCAADQGLFNRVALKAGNRFSIQLSYWSSSAEDEVWTELVNLLGRPDFRLGGGTRSGMGALAVVRLSQGHFNLRQPGDFQRFCDLSPGLADHSGLKAGKLITQTLDSALRITLKLRPEDFYRFGQGMEALEQAEDKDPKLIPQSERRVVWDRNGGRLSDRLVLIPASAVKGALRHRLTYHDNIIRGRFAGMAKALKTPVKTCPAEHELFGFASEEDPKASYAGAVIMDDLFVEPQSVKHIDHNGVDAFTGGVREHVLYREEVVGGEQGLILNLTLLDSAKLCDTTLTALYRVLEDLTEGRLALGAGSGRGHGFFRGESSWYDPDRSIRRGVSDGTT